MQGTWRPTISQMSTISVSQLKTHLSREIREVQRGKSILVTDHDHPVAKLVPIDNDNPIFVRPATKSMKSFVQRSKVKVKIDPLVYLLEDRQR